MMEETKEPNVLKINIRYGIHILLTLLFAAGVAWFSNEVILEKAWNQNYFLFIGVLCGVLALCSFLDRKELYDSVKNIGILTAGFLLSGLLLLLSDFYINLPLWLLGGIAVAALVNRNIGMLYLYFFVFHAIYLQGNLMNGLVFHLVVSTLICFFIPKMKTFLSMLYMMAFAACIIVTGSVINNRMGLDKAVMLDTFYILCTYLGCIFITMLLVKWIGEPEKAEENEDAVAPGNYEYLDLLAQDAAEKDAAAEADAAQRAAEAAEAEAAKKAEEATDTKDVEKEAAAPVETEEVAETVAEEDKPEEVTETVAEEPADETTDETVEDAKDETEKETAEIVAEATVTEEPETPVEAVSEEVLPEEPEAEEIIEEPVAEVSEEVVEEPVEEIIEEIDYTPFCDEKSELLLELRAKNKALYAQAILVGKLASETAKSIGLNVELTKAAGLYKRIGKIREINDEYTAAEVAKEHNFPEPLIYLLEQLNHDIIEQKEAAVILMTDGVISYYSIVRHAQKNDIPVEKIVDMIVSKKIFQGEFNESGLSMQECVVLREKLIALLKDQDRKHAAREAERSKKA